MISHRAEDRFDLFLSYSRKDNISGFVSALHAGIRADFTALAGRSLNVFFDTKDIRAFDDWRHRILTGLRESRLFLACLSPHYFQSAACRWEWEEWIKHEVARGQYGNTATCIYLAVFETLATPEVKASAARWIDDLRRRQGVEFHLWQAEGAHALTLPDAQARLRDLSTGIRGRLDNYSLAWDFPGNISAANPNFVGRTEELDRLHRMAGVGPVGVVIAVQGLGGMGKTALAVQYAHAFARQYPGGRWQLLCEGQSDLRKAVRSLAPALDVTFTDHEQHDDEAGFARILAELRRGGASLLLLDNVDEPSLLDAATVARLPRDGSLYVIATTRLSPDEFLGLPTGSTFLPVDKLLEADALDLLRKHQREGAFSSVEEESAARHIVSILDGLTLAVEAAALYLGRFADTVTCAAYRDRLQANLLSFHDRAATRVQSAIPHGEARVAATLAVTLERLEPAALLILQLASLLPADSIPLPWLRYVGGEFRPDLVGPLKIGEPDSWTEAVRCLIGQRLLQPTDDRRLVRMHRLVQEVVFRDAREVSGALMFRLLVHANTRADRMREHWPEREARWELEPLKLATQLWIGLPTAGALRLANQVSTPLDELGDTPGALDLLEAAFAHAMQIPKVSEDDLAALVNNLGMLYSASGRFDEAERFCRLAVESCERRDPPMLTALAAALSNLGRVLLAKRNDQDAEPFLARAVSIDRENRSATIADIATRLNNLAELRDAQGRSEDAATLYRETMMRLETTPAVHGPLLSRTLHNLGVHLFRQRDLSGATAQLLRAFEIGEAALGPIHPQLASTSGILGLIAEADGRLADAEALQRRAVEIQERCRERKPSWLIDHLESLACVVKKRGRSPEAETLLERALSIADTDLPDDFNLLARLLVKSAAWLNESGKREAAIRAYRRAVNLMARCSHGREHPKLRAALRDYAILLSSTETSEAAILEEVREALREGGLRMKEEPK